MNKYMLKHNFLAMPVFIFPFDVDKSVEINYEEIADTLHYIPTLTSTYLLMISLLKEMNTKF